MKRWSREHCLEPGCNPFTAESGAVLSVDKAMAGNGAL